MKLTKDRFLTDAVWILIKNKVNSLVPNIGIRRKAMQRLFFSQLGTEQHLLVFRASLSFGFYIDLHVCLIFTLITIIVHQNVMLLRAVVCISYAHTAVLSHRSVCISLSVMRNSSVLRNTEHPTTHIKVVLLFTYLVIYII